MNNDLKQPADRIRNTVSTRRRDDKMRQIIDALRRGSMMRDEIRDMMHMSNSGIRKYIGVLSDAGVIEIERLVNPTYTYAGHPVYRLTREPGAVEAYLIALEEGTARAIRKPDEPPRQIHRLQDDTAWGVKAADWPIPDHEPVMAAFYGIAPRRDAAASDASPRDPMMAALYGPSQAQASA